MIQPAGGSDWALVSEEAKTEQLSIAANNEARNLPDKVILLSGDGDFDLLLDRVKKDYAVTAEVYGVKALTADSLIKSADRFHPIDGPLLLNK